MEGQGADVDTEERVPAQYFDIPVVKVEGFVRSRGRGVDGKIVIRSICDRGVDGKLIIRGICDGVVGQSGDAGGRRMSDGSDERRRNRV